MQSKEQKAVTIQEVIARSAEKAGSTQVNQARAWKAIEETIVEALMNNEKVVLSGFATFTPDLLPEREGNRPGTNEKITYARSARVLTRFSLTLRKKISDALWAEK